MSAQDIPTGRSWRSLFFDAVLIVFVMGLGLKASYGVFSARDADAGDECSYLMAASALPKRGLPVVEGSPLYILWYSLLLKTGVSLENLPSLSWAILITLIPAAVFLLVRASGGGRVAALSASGFLLVSSLVDIWPYPMHLAALILILGTALAARLRPALATAAIGLSLLIATYARPEFLYSLYLFAPLALLGGIWLIWRRPKARLSVLLSGVVLAAGSTLIVWGLGSPKGKGDRSLAAFGQHYALNKHTAGERTEHPWIYWETYIRDDFGEAKSLGDAWANNRSAFLRHIQRNAGNLPTSLQATASPQIDLRLLRHHHVMPQPGPPKHPQTEGIARKLVLVTFALGLLGAVIGLRRHLFGSSDVRGLLVTVVMLGFVMAPAIAASLIIYPRFHYLIPTVLFGVAIAATGLHHLPKPAWMRNVTLNRLAVIALGLVFVAVVPNRVHGWCLQSRLTTQETIAAPPTPIRDSVQAIRAMKLQAPVLMMDNGAARSFYAGFGDVYVHPLQVPPGEGFLPFVKRANIGLVVLDPVTTTVPQLRDDPDLKALVEREESDVFRVFRVEGHPEIRLAVRKDLLPPQSANR